MQLTLVILIDTVWDYLIKRGICYRWRKPSIWHLVQISYNISIHHQVMELILVILTNAVLMPDHLASSVRGIVGGIQSKSIMQIEINYITISTTGNAQDFGDLTQQEDHNLVGLSNSTRGLFAGGHPAEADSPCKLYNCTEFVTIASQEMLKTLEIITKNSMERQI